MEIREKVNQVSVSEGVNSLNASSPQFSLSEREEGEEFAVKGLWAFKGKNASKFNFPPEYFRELEELDRRYDEKIEKINQVIRRLERGKKNLEEKRFEELKELQAKYLERAGFKLFGR
jgi:hypothetical protein